jgi:hypothetical protein
MNQKAAHDVENLYVQVLRFLEGAGKEEKPSASGSSRTENRNTFRATPEKYLLKDNLLLLLKDV